MLVEDLFGVLDDVATIHMGYMLERIEPSTGISITGVSPILRSSLGPVEPCCYCIREDIFYLGVTLPTRPRSSPSGAP